MINLKKLEDLEVLHLLSYAMDMIVELEEDSADTYLINYAKCELSKYILAVNNPVDDRSTIINTNKLFNRICAVAMSHTGKHANQINVKQEKVKEGLAWLFSKHEELRTKAKYC